MDQNVVDYLDKFAVSDAVRKEISGTSQMYIDGEFTDGQSKGTIDVIEPSTEGRLTDVVAGTEADVDAAVAAARRAFESGPWAEMMPAERERILMGLADLMEAHADTLAQIETIDNGKPISTCKDFDIMSSAGIMRYMAGWATKYEGSTKSVSSPGLFSYTLKEPIGLVAAISPWNWPLLVAMMKCAAPLAAGCTVVLKTSEITPLSSAYFAKLTKEAGIPDGVFNIVTGDGGVVGDYLARHPGVDKVSFTGSTATGRSVGEAAASHYAPCTLELGGKSPMVAFEDADLEAIAETCRWSIYLNAGQNCSAGSRLYLHRSVYEQGLEAIKNRISGMVVAPGLDPESEISPVISARQRDRIKRYLEIGANDGKVIFGGDTPDRPGYFINPTLFAVEDNNSPVVQDEIFGPVLVALPFDNEDEVVTMANDNPYGLAASVWTADNSRAQRVSRAIKAGNMFINAHDLSDFNAPFGGFKQSGHGKDLGREQFDQMMSTKCVHMAY